MLLVCFVLVLINPIQNKKGSLAEARNLLRVSPNTQVHLLDRNGPYNSPNQFLDRHSEMPWTEGYQSDLFDRTRGVGFGGKLCQKMRKEIEKSLQGKRPDEAAYKAEFTEYMVKCQMINGGHSPPS